ncbi:MAG: hypothetical protein AAGF12_02310 [Myxococcota bacterium]
MSAYRGIDSALAARLQVLDRAIAEAEARLSADFWSKVAPDLELARPRSASPDELPSQELVEERRVRLSALESVLADLDSIEAHWATAPAAVAPTDREQPAAPATFFPRETLDPEVRRPLAAEDWIGFVQHFRSHVPGLVLRRRSGGRWGHAIRIDDVPIDLQAAAMMGGNNNRRFSAAVATSVSPAAGPLRLDPEGFFQDLLELVGLRREIELGDARFDPVFIIRGHEPSVRGLLTSAVRTDLLKLSVETTARLLVDDRRAILQFILPVSGEAIEAALRVITALHRAPPPSSLRAGPTKPTSS